MSVFKACDIRGLYGKEISEDLARDIGYALGYKIKRREVVVGGDLRLSTPALKTAVQEGLLAMGAKIIDLGIVPTPLFYFARAKLNAYGGVMVTASHNPAEFNGIKFILGDLPPLEEEVREIERLVIERPFSDGVKRGIRGEIRQLNLENEYLSFLREESAYFEAPADKQLKIVIDAGNGSFSHLAPEFFRHLNFTVIPLFCEPDGHFPSRNPNPVIPGSLNKLSRKVKEEKAHLGLAFDGDGDRVVFVDEKGRVLPADQAMVILGSTVRKKAGPGKVIYDLKCSEIVAEEFARMGCLPLPEKSGHSYIKSRMIKEKAIFAGEVSGHFFFGRLGRDESLLAASLMVFKLSRDNVSLSALADTLPHYYSTPDIRIPYEGDKEEILRKIKEAGRDFEVMTLDGVRIKYPEGWGLVRISITEPLLTFRFEARSREGLEKVMGRFLEPVPELIADIRKYVKA